MTVVSFVGGCTLRDACVFEKGIHSYSTVQYTVGDLGRERVVEVFVPSCVHISILSVVVGRGKQVVSQCGHE